MKNANRIDWKLPLALLVLSAIPIAAGLVRVAGLANPAGISAENARFVAAPIPIVLHIIGASLFSVLGALQFSRGLRQRSPRWHRVCGRVVFASGVLSALTGVWMTVAYAIPPELQGGLLLGVRVVVGLAMFASLVLAVTAAMGGDIARHRAWMIRAYALGQGAGMQVVVLLPWMLVIGTPSMVQRDVLMTLAWVINLLVAELAVHGWPQRNFLLHRTTL
jgi:uncharacterized membrane protein